VGRWSDSHDLHKSPGPGQYPKANPGAVAKQVLSTKPSAHKVLIGTSRRKPLVEEGADILVGPGEYGSTQLQRYKFQTDASYSFSVAGRKRPAVGDPTNSSGSTVGPNTSVHSSMGRQRDSTRRSAPSCTMSGRVAFGSPCLW